MLARAAGSGGLVLPLQVLGEFCNVALRKAGHAPAWVEEFVVAWSAVAEVKAYRLADLRAALRARAEAFDRPRFAARIAEYIERRWHEHAGSAKVVGATC